MKNVFYIVFGLCLSLVFFFCDNEVDFLIGGEFELEFFLDILCFDIVFMELGFVMCFFKVYNCSSNFVLIDVVVLIGNEDGKFCMNVNGIVGDWVEQVEIWVNDSIYVFVEVIIDFDVLFFISFFVIEDQVVFEIGEKCSSVFLEVWGQNVNYFFSCFNWGVLMLFICNN